jgi:hypothetical protein
LVEGEGHALARTKLIETIMESVKVAYKAFEEQVGDQVALAEIEKIVLLRSMDDLWIEHLENMDNNYANEVIIYGQDGEEAARVIYSPDKPLSCGAKVWIETNGRVEKI